MTIQSLQAQVTAAGGISAANFFYFDDLADQLPVGPNNNNQTDLDKSIAKIASIMDWMHFTYPNSKIGLYDILPADNYWCNGTVPVTATNCSSWNSHNAYLKVLADHVDVVFPRLYVDYQNQWQDWVTTAVANIQQAKQYNKPVYVFLMPQYADSSRAFIDGPAWRLVLETAYQYADGVVIWGGWDLVNNPSTGPIAWATYSQAGDPSACSAADLPTSWWCQTLDFMKTKGLGSYQ